MNGSPPAAAPCETLAEWDYFHLHPLFTPCPWYKANTSRSRFFCQRKPIVWRYPPALRQINFPGSDMVSTTWRRHLPHRVWPERDPRISVWSQKDTRKRRKLMFLEQKEKNSWEKIRNIGTRFVPNNCLVIWLKSNLFSWLNHMRTVIRTSSPPQQRNRQSDLSRRKLCVWLKIFIIILSEENEF
jgi:hypothetical protein